VFLGSGSGFGSVLVSVRVFLLSVRVFVSIYHSELVETAMNTFETQL